jgi:glycerol uptake facilitator-like aquaporin
MSGPNGFSSKPNPHFENMVEVGANGAHHQHARRTTFTQMMDRDFIVDFLKEWFDPEPQLREMCQVAFWKDILVEAMALGYILIAVILLLNTCNAAHYTPYPLIIGVFASMMIFSSVDGWGPMCGCVLNPAGILGFYLAGRMSFVRAFFRIAAEFGGAAAGAMIGYGLVPDSLKSKVFALKRSENLSLNQAGSVEGILTFNLVLVALSVTTPGKHTVLHTLTIGCCKATGLLAAGSYTGGIQNPAIAMGPAVASKDFHEHFSVYWLGPFIGGVVAALVYNVVQYINKRDAQIKEKEDYIKRREAEANVKMTTLAARGRSDSQIPCTEEVDSHSYTEHASDYAK